MHTIEAGIYNDMNEGCRLAFAKLDDSMTDDEKSVLEKYSAKAEKKILMRNY